VLGTMQFKDEYHYEIIIKARKKQLGKETTSK
jgi:hypothetical protein